MPVRLFVGNLSYQATETELRELFSAVGPLAYVHLPTDRESGKPRGFAFVEFQDPAQAAEAIQRFNNQPFQGRPLAVNEARARDTSAGIGRSASAPPSLPPTDRTRGPGGADTPPSQRSRDSRQFGPDAAPRGQRKSANRRPKSTTGPKGPLRERFSGQFFGGDEDEPDVDTPSRGHVAHGPGDAARGAHD